MKFIWIGIPALLVIGAIVGGVFIYQYGVSEKKQEIVLETITTSLVAAPTPTPTAEFEFNKVDYKIKVLNGAGVAGTAGKAKEFLEELEYENIEVGNANSYNYKETEVSAKEGASKYVDALINDLAKEYVVLDDVGLLSEDDIFDVIIVIGSK